MARVRAVILPLLVLVACPRHEETRPVVTVTIGATPDAAAPTSPSDAGGVPVAFRGPFHLPGHADEINLILEDDGTFRWRIYGCDFSGGADGKWWPMPGGIELNAGGADFTWPAENVFNHAVAMVYLKARSDGAIDVTARSDPDLPDVHQTWLRGRVCAKCGQALGPVAGPAPCNDPIPR